MKRIGVDANVVLSLLIDRDEGQRARAMELFGGAIAGEHLVVIHQAAINETVYVMTGVYDVKPARVSDALGELLELPGVVVINALDWPTVWRLWPRRMKDFGDACIAAASEHSAFDELATFDVSFARRARRHGLATVW